MDRRFVFFAMSLIPQMASALVPGADFPAAVCIGSFVDLVSGWKYMVASVILGMLWAVVPLTVQANLITGALLVLWEMSPIGVIGLMFGWFGIGIGMSWSLSHAMEPWFAKRGLLNRIYS